MFSLIQTPIENGLYPYKYPTWLLKQAKNADLANSKLYRVCCLGTLQQL